MQQKPLQQKVTMITGGLRLTRLSSTSSPLPSQQPDFTTDRRNNKALGKNLRPQMPSAAKQTLKQEVEKLCAKPKASRSNSVGTDLTLRLAA